MPDELLFPAKVDSQSSAWAKIARSFVMNLECGMLDIFGHIAPAQIF